MKKCLFFHFRKGEGKGFSRLTKFDSHKVYISCIQLKGNTISFHLIQIDILSRLFSIHLMLAKTNFEKKSKNPQKAATGCTY